MDLYIEEAPGKGRGVFTAQTISKGSIIEQVPVIIFPAEQWDHIGETEVCEFCYYWGEDLKDGAIALGYCSLYNHSFQPNARFKRDLANQKLIILALRDIEAQEEILINYNGDPEDTSPIWFDPI